MSISCLNILQCLCGLSCHVVVSPTLCIKFSREGNCILHPWPHLSKLLISNLYNAVNFLSQHKRLGDMWILQEITYLKIWISLMLWRTKKRIIKSYLHFSENSCMKKEKIPGNHPPCNHLINIWSKMMCMCNRQA